MKKEKCSFLFYLNLFLSFGLSLFLTLGCANRELKSIQEKSILSDFKTSYWLLDRQTQDIVGESQTHLEGYTAKGKQFYRLQESFSIESQTASKLIQIKTEHHSIVDQEFRLRSFAGTWTQNQTKTFAPDSIENPTSISNIPQNKKESTPPTEYSQN